MPRPVATSDSLQLRAAILTRLSLPGFHRRDSHGLRPPLPRRPAIRRWLPRAPCLCLPGGGAPRHDPGGDRRGDHRVHTRERPEGPLLFPTRPGQRRRSMSRISSVAPGNYGETGMAHLLEHLLLRAHPRFRASSRSSAPRVRQTGRRSSTGRITSSRSPPPTKSSTGRSRWRPPDGQFVRREKGPRHRDDRGAQRIRKRRKQSAARPLGQVDGNGVRLAQLRQPHDRRALGHRERRYLAAAGVLQAVLPAR